MLTVPGSDLSAAERRRLARLEKLARDVRRLEGELYRSIRRANDAGYSLRELEAVTGIPRTTIDRRLKAES